MTSLINTIVLIVLIHYVDAPWWLYVMLGAAIATDILRALYEGRDKDGENV